MKKQELRNIIRKRFDESEEAEMPAELKELQDNLEFELSYKQHDLQLISTDVFESIKEKIVKMIEISIDETIKHYEELDK